MRDEIFIELMSEIAKLGALVVKMREADELDATIKQLDEGKEKVDDPF